MNGIGILWGRATIRIPNHQPKPPINHWLKKAQFFCWRLRVKDRFLEGLWRTTQSLHRFFKTSFLSGKKYIAKTVAIDVNYFLGQTSPDFLSLLAVFGTNFWIGTLGFVSSSLSSNFST